MKTKRTAPYRFDPGKEARSFKEIYDRELSSLRLAHRIAELREKRSLTQADLARRVGTTQAGISRVENPNYRAHSLATLEKIALALGARLKVDLEEGVPPLDKKTAGRRGDVRLRR